MIDDQEYTERMERGVEKLEEKIIKLESEKRDLVAALIEAKAIIRTWHDMGIGPDDEAWKIYDQQSPEMRRINSVLSAYAKGPT